MTERKKGVALILTVGVLALMAMIGVSFTINVTADYKASASLTLAAQARTAAEAGLGMATAYMRHLAFSDFNAVPTSSCDWNYISASNPSFDLRDGTAGNSTSGLLGPVGMGNTAVFTLRVVDTASQINANDTNPGLGAMLENLVSVLGAPLQPGDGSAIVNNRPAGGYECKEQVVDSIPGADLSVKRAKFEALADHLTVNGYIDAYSGSTSDPPLTGLNSPAAVYHPKAPVNINTAGTEVLQAVLRQVLSDDKASALSAAIMTQRATVPFRSWNGAVAAGGFDGFIDTVAISPALLSSEKIAVKNNANPNRVKPAAYSTDFCFHPSGYYEITSAGMVGLDANSDGDLADAGDIIRAEKRMNAIVRIYGILNMTAKEQFRGEDSNYNGTLDPGEDRNGNGILDNPVFERMTWLNSCPVVSSDDQGLRYRANYTVIPNSLKMGYWDNFDEDNDNTLKKGYTWYYWTAENNTMVITDADSDGDCELTSATSAWPKFKMDATAANPSWKFGNNFSIRAFLRPDQDPASDGSNVTGHIIFAWGAYELGNLWTQNWLFYYDNNVRQDLTRVPPQSPQTVANDLVAIPFEGKDYCDSKVVLNMAQNLFTGTRNDRTYNIGNICYGYTDAVTDHYNNYMAEENRDAYHGVFPDSEVLKLAVNSRLLPGPDYRVSLAVGPGRHYKWRYNGTGLIGTDIVLPVDNNYHSIPLESSNSAKYDRYGYYPTINNISNTWQASSWFLRLYAEKAATKWDDIRIIPDQAYYQSSPFTASSLNGGNPIRWGTASWTLTIPPTANAANETVAVRANTGSGYIAVPFNGAINRVSSSMTYRLDFATTDDDYSETPAVEDITITYLPEARVIYRREL